MRRYALIAVLAVLGAYLGRGVTTPGPGSSAERNAGRVTRVVDGDTLHVDVRGRDVTVRLLGIDSPELHKPGTPVECGARAAAAVMTELADGEDVRLIGDPTQDARDRYGRRLAYVVLRGSGRDVGKTLVQRGWASVYVFDRPFQRVRSYRAAARTARRAGLGVNRACGGDFHSAS